MNLPDAIQQGAELAQRQPDILVWVYKKNSWHVTDQYDKLKSLKSGTEYFEIVVRHREIPTK